jgi:hypothetical protein
MSENSADNEETGLIESAESGAATPNGEIIVRDTHFDFQHKVFLLPGAFFSLDTTSKDPVLNILLGDLKAALPFNTIRESFDIPEDSNDRHLLDVVAKGLRFVKVIRPGEQIPGELLDGRASWAVEDRHRVIARGRLTMQLISWITGAETIITDLSQLEQIIDDPQSKNRVREACAQIAQRLGIANGSEQYITDRVDDLSQELSYIEALRDRFSQIRAMDENLGKIAQIYRSDRGFVSEVSRMRMLFKKPLRAYDAVFEQADAQTGEIIGALKDFKTTITFIRTIRDDLRARLLEWEDMLSMWNEVEIERSTKIEQICKQTYRFLANRFIEVQVWERKK